METYHALGKAGDDGVLHLDIPVGAPNSEFEVVVILQPKRPANRPDDFGWPPGYFEQTAGSIQDPTFYRHDQGGLPSDVPFSGIPESSKGARHA